MSETRHKVVLVDDNLATLQQGKALLSPYYQVYTYDSAATLFENLESGIPDLILLDVEMPEMDGFETIAKLKRDERYRDIPVIFLTAKSDEESERKGFALGAVDYVTKPFSAPLLRKRISNQILLMRVQSAVRDYAVNIEILMDELSKANEELVAAKEFAEQSSHYKSSFLANMSHEIRTPMNVILGITEIQLQHAALPEDLTEGLEKIHESGSLLLNIINDILDLSKIEAGKLEIMPVNYDIPSLINDVALLNHLRYEGKAVDFCIDIDENTPLNLFGDELRIKQILGNILSNAFKYTDSGRVELSIWTEPLSPDAVTLYIRVRDTGQGMTTEQLERLFSEYTRFNPEKNRTIVGTGLGLNITKHLLSLMDGEINVESEHGKGSTFTICLPQKRVDELVCGRELVDQLSAFRFQRTVAEKTRISRKHMPEGSVLVVDDVASNIYVTKGMLLPYGLNIDIASSGFEAISKIEGGNAYDIIFMDHLMPKMNGIETTKKLRDMGYNGTIIALTANALVGQAEVFLQNGFDSFISKPIDTQELDAALNKYIP